MLFLSVKIKFLKKVSKKIQVIFYQCDAAGWDGISLLAKTSLEFYFARIKTAAPIKPASFNVTVSSVNSLLGKVV